MIHDLDTSLDALLNDPAAPADLRAAATSFETPERTYHPAANTINLFLYEVQENRELRETFPETRPSSLPGLYTRRMPPLRVDCTYLVTAWAASGEVGAARVQIEHRLLSQGLVWLSRFPLLPTRFLAGSLANQVNRPLSLAAQASVRADAGEFWSALGIPPRPAFLLTVMIQLDLALEETEFPVTTATAAYLQSQDPERMFQLPGSRETLYHIGGVVRSSTGQPLAGVRVILEPGGHSAVSDSQGRYRLFEVASGLNYTLTAYAAGLGSVPRLNVEIPSPTGEYDLHF